MLETVTAPFAQATTRLKKTADGRVLDYWMLQMGQNFVERIIEVNPPSPSDALIRADAFFV